VTKITFRADSTSNAIKNRKGKRPKDLKTKQKRNSCFLFHKILKKVTKIIFFFGNNMQFCINSKAFFQQANDGQERNTLRGEGSLFGGSAWLRTGFP